MSKKQEPKRVVDNVLAAGEFTGHHHRGAGKDVAVFETDAGQKYMEAPNGATITHEEHAPIQVDAGNYDIRIVTEVDPMSEEIRAVRD